MDVRVVYESMFGLTRDVAVAVAEGLSTRAHVDLDEVGDAARQIAPTTSLLVVGAPTHLRGLSRRGSREDAARRSPTVVLPDTEQVGMREWIELLRGEVVGVRAVAFDTRLAGRMAGSAAAKAHKLLVRRGFELAGEPQGFVVEGATGPLRPGELDRARAWGEQLARQEIDRARLAGT